MLQRTSGKSGVDRLTDKERECLQRWLDHRTAKEIALELGISHHAVEKRLKSARAKLGVSSTIEAARLLGEAEGYRRTASQSADLSLPTERTTDGLAGTARPRPRSGLIFGVAIMSMTILTLALLSSGNPPASTSRAAQPQGSPEVLVFDQRRGVGTGTQAADAAFARLDKDGSGFIEMAEWPTLRVRAVRLDGDDRAQSTINVNPATSDANKDGRVSREEYRSWMADFVRQLQTEGQAG